MSSPPTQRHLQPIPSLQTKRPNAQYITGQPRDYQKTQQRLSAHIADHQKYGFGLYATILKTTNQFIGRCGIEPVETNNQLRADIA